MHGFVRIGFVVVLFVMAQVVDARTPHVARLTGFEIHEIITQLLQGDFARFDELAPPQQRQVFGTIEREKIYPDDSKEFGYVSSSYTVNLPICSPGYWGARWAGEKVEHNAQTLGLKYQVGANCYRWDYLGDCEGTDDIMLSFYLGNHAESLEQLAPMLRWASNSIVATTYFMVMHGGKMATRLYEQTPYGTRDNYNLYACIPGYLYPYINTFVIRKY